MSITLSLKPNQTKDFDPELVFDANYDMTVVQSGVITFSADLTNALPGSINRIRVLPNGNAINFPSQSPNGTIWEVPMGSLSTTKPMVIEVQLLATGRINTVIGQLFDLTDVASFVDDWDSSILSQFVTTGGLVDTWTGRQGNILTGTTTERPTLSASVVQFRGAQCLVGDGLATHFTGTDTPWAAIAKVRLNSLVVANNVIFSSGQNVDLDPNTGLRIINDAPRFNRADDGATAANQSFGGTIGSVNTYNIGLRFTGTTVRPYIDGIEQPGSPLASNVGLLTLNRFAIGCLRRDVNSLYGNFDLSRFTLFTDNPSDSDWAKIQQYLLI